MGKISVKWCGILAAFVLAVPVLSATAVGEGVGTRGSQPITFVKAATVSYGVPDETPLPSQRAVAELPDVPHTPVPTPTPPPTAPATPVTPPQTPLPTATMAPPWTGDLCAEVASINVVDVELTGVVQEGIDALSHYFGCQKFRIDGSGVPVKFGEITPLLNAKGLGYAYSAPGVYEIWLNRDCWGVVERWDGVMAHELGHYLGWRHGDDHPYMWLPPPPGSYARPGDAAIVC